MYLATSYFLEGEQKGVENCNFFFQVTFSINLHLTFSYNLILSVSVPIDLKINLQTPCTEKSIEESFCKIMEI